MSARREGSWRAPGSACCSCSCSADRRRARSARAAGDDLDGFADIQRYCSQREQLVCVRRNLRKEITNGQRDDCRRAALKQCASRSWAPECHPTEREARACINALSDLDTLKTPEDEIHECSTKALCTLHYVPSTGGNKPGTSITSDAGTADEDGGAGESR